MTETQEFSCSVLVTDVQGEEMGAVATIEFVQPSVGIDISPTGPVQIQITEDAAAIVQKGAYLRLTFSNSDPIPAGAPRPANTVYVPLNLSSSVQPDSTWLYTGWQTVDNPEPVYCYSGDHSPTDQNGAHVPGWVVYLNAIEAVPPQPWLERE